MYVCVCVCVCVCVNVCECVLVCACVCLYEEKKMEMVSQISDIRCRTEQDRYYNEAE